MTRVFVDNDADDADNAEQAAGKGQDYSWASQGADGEDAGEHWGGDQEESAGERGGRGGEGAGRQGRRSLPWFYVLFSAYSQGLI